jgi:hypothetical protein
MTIRLAGSADYEAVRRRHKAMSAADARIRVSSHRLSDPFLRQLPEFRR